MIRISRLNGKTVDIDCNDLTAKDFDNGIVTIDGDRIGDIDTDQPAMSMKETLLALRADIVYSFPNPKDMVQACWLKWIDTALTKLE